MVLRAPDSLHESGLEACSGSSARQRRRGRRVALAIRTVEYVLGIQLRGGGRCGQRRGARVAGRVVGGADTDPTTSTTRGDRSVLRAPAAGGAVLSPNHVGSAPGHARRASCRDAGHSSVSIQMWNLKSGVSRRSSSRIVQSWSIERSDSRDLLGLVWELLEGEGLPVNPHRAWRARYNGPEASSHPRQVPRITEKRGMAIREAV